MNNYHFSKGQGLIIVGSLLASIALTILTVGLAGGPSGFPEWFNGLGAAVLSLARIAPWSSTAAESGPVEPYGYPVAVLLIAYWGMLCGAGLLVHARTTRKRRLEERRRQKKRADRVLGRHPDEYPLPEDR